MSVADQASGDPAGLSIDALRRERAELQQADDVVSYVRRIAQARIDLVRATSADRSGEATDGPRDDVDTDGPAGALRDVLATQLTAAGSRPPRPIDAIEDHPLVEELDELATAHGFSRLDDLDGDGLDRLAEVLSAFERRVSDDRRARYDRLDALSAELVRRYRDGEASVDQLLAGDER